MPGRSPRIPCGECRSLSMLASSGLARRSVTVVPSGPPRSSSARLARPGRFRCVRRTWHSPHHAVGGSAGLAAGLVCGPVEGRAGQRAVRAAADLGGVRAAVGRWAGRRGEGAGGRRPGRVVCCRAGPVGGAGVSVRPAAHAGGRRRFAGCARGRVPARRRGVARGLAGRGRALRGGVRPADGRTGRRDRRAAAAESALGALGWDHTDSGVWPAIDCLDNRDQSVVPAYVVDTAERARGRILAAGLPCVLGHADFEAQNLRWHGQQVWAVHDWDSLAWQPEAALAGAASGSFASAGPPTLAPIESSEAFLVAYQDVRGRLFTAVEQEIAWAASVWMAAYNAREEALHGHTPVCRDALRAQAAERLRRANA